MGRILRVGLMVLLVAAAGVGNALGEWKDYTPGTSEAITWQYEEIDATSCRIKPKDKNAISGKVDIPEKANGLKVVEIAEVAFSDCSKLTGVKFPNGLTTIEERAFFGCSGLTEVKFPNGLTTIGNSAFWGCRELTEVNISDSVETIQGWAFYECEKLKKVSISSSVRAIGAYAFYGCKELTAFEVDAKNARYSQVGGVLFTNDRDSLVSYPGGRKGDYNIPSSVKGIKGGVFKDCKGLTAVTIPGSVKTIEVWTFFGCTGLTAVYISDGVTEIEKSAFQGCDKLKEVTIPGSVKTIGQFAFLGCSSLNTVYVYRPIDQEFTVDGMAFVGIDSQATLYVRPGMKAKIQNEEWHKYTFTNIVECYVVTFQDGEENKLGEQLVKPNGTATALRAPTRKGYTFVEWQLDGAKYDFSTPVTKDITLMAVWEQKDDSETAVESVQLAAVRAVRNPVGEALELEGMERAARVEVYSVVGARVYAEALRGEPRVVIDARGWASGVYVVRVEASDGAKTLRVVK